LFILQYLSHNWEQYYSPKYKKTGIIFYIGASKEMMETLKSARNQLKKRKLIKYVINAKLRSIKGEGTRYFWLIF